MMPWRSTAVPIMKPGTSAKNTSGTLNALHVEMKRAALSAESLNSTPPLWFGWLATSPTARPSRRAKPTISSFAQRAWISSSEPSSISAAISACMSNGLFSSSGISSEMSGPGCRRAGAGGAAGGAPSQLLGK